MEEGPKEGFGIKSIEPGFLKCHGSSGGKGRVNELIGQKTPWGGGGERDACYKHHSILRATGVNRVRV